MVTALEQNREDQALGAAWRRCEVALPGGWRIQVDWQYGNDCRVLASGNPLDGRPEEWAPTLTEALTALAEALEARRRQ